MRKIFTNYALLFWLLLFGQLHSQAWVPVGSATGISAGAVGRMTLLNDINDNLVVGYQDVENGSVGSVQRFDGTSWSYLGGQPGVTEGTATYNSTAVDSQGVVYFTNQTGWPESGLEAKKFENNTWVSLPNATNASINYNTSTVSPDGTLYVASGDNSGTIRKLVNGAWIQVGTSGFFNGVAFYVDMVIGTNGKVYLSFNNGGNVHVYMNDINAGTGDAWQPVGGNIDLVSSTNSENYNSSLAIDSNNNLYIAYISSNVNKLNVKKFDGTSWSQVGNENFTQTRVQHISIAVGQNNKIYVAESIWEDTDMLRNYVMTYDEASNIWVKVGSGYVSEGQATYNSLAIDSSGNLYLAFSDSALDKLSVKKLNENLVAIESVEISTENGEAPEINTDNGTLQLKATVLPQEANQNVIWSISEGGTFATISNSGLVTAIASDAVVTIKAISAENPTISNTIHVTIKNQDSDVDAENVVVKTTNGKYPDIFSIGGNLQLTATVSPAEADQKVLWSVQQGTSIASVNNDGLVTSLAEGSAIIRATNIDGTVYGEIKINVFKNGCSQGNEVFDAGLGYSITNNIFKGTDDFIVPEGTRFNVSKIRMNVIASSDFANVPFNIAFLKNDNGMPGSLIKEIQNIQPTSQKLIEDLGFGNYEYEVELDLPADMIFDQGTYWLNPMAVSDENVYWNVTTLGGIGESYYIDALDGHGWRTLGGGGFNAAFEITGNCTPMPVVVNTVNGSDATVFIGENLQLKATVNAQGISQNVIWTLDSGSGFASVNENGIVTGLMAGTAIIKATSADNENVFGTLEVTVLDSNACSREVFANEIEDAYLLNGTTEQRLAVDFEVQGSSFTIDSVEPSVADIATSLSFVIYKDENGFPGAEVASSNGQIVHDMVIGDEFNLYFHRYKVKLDNQITLPTGKYWMEMKGDALAWQATYEDVQGNPGAFFNNNTNTWSYLNAEFVYKINGVCETLGTSEVDRTTKLSYYPNPVTDYLNLSSEKQIDNVVIYNLAGQQIATRKVNNKDGKINIDTLTSGVYMIKTVFQDGQSKTFKIIKK